MSSLGTGRVVDVLTRALAAAELNPNGTEAERARLRRELQTAREIHQDYLQSERDDARAERDSE